MHDPLDSLFDSHLRDVPLPEGLAERLRGIAEPTDENLDRWLRDVPCPQTVLARCRSVTSDELLEELLCNCDVPVGLAARLRAIPFARSPVALATLARAAMLFLMIGGSYCTFLGWFLASLPMVVRDDRSAIQLQLAYMDQGRAASIWGDDSEFFVSSEELVTTEELTDIARPGQIGDPLLSTWEPRVVENSWTLSDVRLADEMAKRNRSTNEMIEPSARTLLTHLFMLSRQRPPRPTQLAVRAPAIATPQESLFQPLSSSDIGAFHGNLNLLVKNFEARPDMSVVEVPVTTDVTSFDIFEELVREGRWPEGLDIRTEEFLAAMRYDFPSVASREIAIFPAAATTPLAQRESILVQIGIKAGGIKGGVTAPTSNPEEPVKAEVVTSQATVTVRFHPQTVKAFRLIGHEPRAVNTDMPIVVQSRPLCAGDETVLLFEVWLRPGNSRVIADTIVNWYDPHGERSKQVSAQFQRPAAIPAFSAAAPSLQVAAMAAESAETLRNHRHNDSHAGSIRAVREALRSTNNRLVATPEVQRLVRLLDAAVQLRPELLGK